MKVPKVDTSGTERAQKAIADAQTAATNLERNFKQDLSVSDVAAVKPGAGAAEALGLDTGVRKRKPGSSGGLASALGISV